MPELPDLKQLLNAGAHFTEMRRSEARRIVNGLVERGQLAREQATNAVDELISLSRERSEALAEVIRNEVQRQMRVLGIATLDDIQALERRMGRAGTATKAPAKKTAAKKTATGKTTAKKAPAKKTAAKKAPATRAPAKKTAAKKTTAKRAPAKKTAAKKAPARKRAR